MAFHENMRRILLSLACACVLQFAQAQEADGSPPTAPCAKAVPANAEPKCQVRCSTTLSSNDYPPEAKKLGIETGTAVVQFTVDADYQIVNPVVLSSTHPSFAESALALARRATCTGPKPGKEVTLRVPFGFRLE
jgi:TonB family protein